MNGTMKALSNTGCPWPGGDPVSFTQADVIALGKLRCYGSSCIQFIVKLADGRDVFVRADKQSKADEKFLRKLARKVQLVGYPTRNTGWTTNWTAL